MGAQEPMLYRSHLDTLLFLVGSSLERMKAAIDAPDTLDGPARLNLWGQLANLDNMVSMVSELASNHELALHEAAHTLQGLADAGRIDRTCLDKVLDTYTAAMGQLEADRLFAAAMEA